MREPGQHDRYVYNMAAAQANAAPSLVKVAVYCIRHHLVTCHGTTLYAHVDRLEIPPKLKDMLTLRAFVDYQKPIGQREEF